jgi:hypothetical protein
MRRRVGKREIRRCAGAISAALPHAELELIADPRSERGRVWSLRTLLSAVLMGLMTAQKGLRQVEMFSGELTPWMRDLVGLRRDREVVPDTTMRDILVALGPWRVRPALVRTVRAAYRRKACQPSDLPFGAVAQDGKVTSIDAGATGHYAQGQDGYSLMRTITSCLISSSARPCIDMIPVPATTNEMGHFQAALRALLHAYRGIDLFRLVSYDSGACSRENAQFVVEQTLSAGRRLEYLFVLKENQPTLAAEARRQLCRLRPEQCTAMTERVEGDVVTVRHLYATEEMAGFDGWTHLQTTLRMHVETRRTQGNELITSEDRYFISSLPAAELAPHQWLNLIVAHWGVETVHQALDVAFLEDDRPWITADEKGMLAVALLRRLAYTILALFRGVSLRSEDSRRMRWGDLMRLFYVAALQATEDVMAGVRPRSPLGVNST